VPRWQAARIVPQGEPAPARRRLAVSIASKSHASTAPGPTSASISWAISAAKAVVQPPS
jgi:hypothetical protein